MLNRNQKVWEKIYCEGRQINKYPFSDLPSHVFSLYGKNTDKSRLRVLEVGSGAGANLWFFSREGFRTYGIDFSPSACVAAQRLLKKDGLKAEIKTANFVQLPFEDSFFNLVLDRNSLYCLAKKDFLKACSEIKRVLKQGGRFLSFMYPVDNECIKYGMPRKIETNTYTDFKKGPFVKTGITHFVTEKEIREEIYKGFKIEYIKKIKHDFIYPEKVNEITLVATSGIKLTDSPKKHR